MARGTGVYKVYSGFEDGTMYFWHTNRYRTEANTLFALSSAGLILGVDGSGADFTWYGDNPGDFILFDESENRAEFEDIVLRMKDDTKLEFGEGNTTDGDYSIRYALGNTRLEILSRVANGEIWFGDGSINPDIRIAGSNSTNNIFVDSSEDQMRFTGMTIEMQSTSKIQFEDAGLYIHASADGKLKLSSDGAGADDITLSGTITLDDDITTGAGKGFASTMRMQTTSKVEMNDAGTFLHSSSDGKILLSSDGVAADDITLSGTVTLDDNLTIPDDVEIIFGDDQDFTIGYDNSNSQLEILPKVANDEIWFGDGVTNPDLRIAGSDSTNHIFMDSSEDQMRFTGVEIEMQGTAKIQFEDAGLYIHASTDGKLKLASDGGGADDITLSGTVTLDDNLTVPDNVNVIFGGSQDFTIDWNSANSRLMIVPAATNSPLWFGDGSINPDLRIAGSDSTNNIFMDSSEDQLRFTGVEIEMQGTAKIQLNDDGTFIHSNADGKIMISSDGGGADDINLDGSVSITDDITMTDGKGFAADVLFSTDKKSEYRDDAVYIHSSENAHLDLVSDDVIYLNGNIQRKAATEILGANKTFILTDASVQFLDPGGAGRTVFMPITNTANRFEMQIINTADASEELDVNTAAGTTILTIAQDETGFLICNGVAWGRYVGKTT